MKALRDSGRKPLFKCSAFNEAHVHFAGCSWKLYTSFRMSDCGMFDNYLIYIRFKYRVFCHRLC